VNVQPGNRGVFNSSLVEYRPDHWDCLMIDRSDVGQLSSLMSSRLQLDMRNLSLGRRHLVNAYEVEAGIGVIAGNTV